MVSTPVEIFCCYCHADERRLRKLETHLSLLKRQCLISFWYDRLIAPGTDRAKDIDRHLETASVILLLMSADFLASEYCYSAEMKRALQRHEANEARVIPILLRPADYKDAPFAHLQVLPTDARPLSLWRKQERALADIAAGIRRVIEDVAMLTASAPRATLPSIWNIPYPRNPFFLGRDDELALVHRYFHARQATAQAFPLAISGLGGIGKTQLALEYAYRYHQDYQMVLWARAESAETLVSSYIAIATLLRLPEREAKEQEVTVQAVKSWLQAHSSWLLILDNADELTLLSDFLPPSLGGHLLLTTQATATGQWAHRLDMTILLPEQGALFLLRRATLLAPDATLEQALPQEREMALQIAQELGGLLLALDQAGAYLEATGMNLGDYWQIYQQHQADLLQERGTGVIDHPAPVATTWSLSFQKIEQKNPAAAELLRLLAFLSPHAIPEEILTQGASHLGFGIAPVLTDAFRFNQVIEVLRNYSLVRRDPKEKVLSMHRLVQAVLKNELEKTERRVWTERALLAINAAFPHTEQSTWSQCERLLPHALLAAHSIETDHLINKEAGRLLQETAFYLRSRGRYAKAEPLYERALRVREQQFGPDHLEVAQTLNALANLYREQSKYEEAEPLFQRALRIREQQFGPNHPEVAQTLNNLALLYYYQGKYAEAEPLYERSLRIHEQQSGPEQPQVAHPLINLALLYFRQGKYGEAEPLYLRALRIQERCLGSEHLDVAYALNNLADLYKEQGKYAEAESLYQRALHIREQQLGLEHPQVAYCLSGLANLYGEQGKFAQAQAAQQQALEIRERQLGPEHPYVAISLNNLAELFLLQSKYSEAEPLFQRALRIQERQLGPDHPDMAYVLDNLANLYREQCRYEEAEPLLKRALHIREQTIGSEHLETAAVMHNLARLWEAQENNEEARSWYTRTLAVYERVAGEHHPKTTEVRTHLIALLYSLGLSEQAAQLEAIQSAS